MAVFVLGPSKWLKRRLKKPTLARLDHLPEDWDVGKRRIASPLDLRVELAEYLNRHGHAACVMERAKQRRNESNIQLFQRIIREKRVRQFFVVWPADAGRTGLDFELGALMDRIAAGQELDVRLFVESRAGSIDKKTGTFHSKDRAPATRYYHDLVRHGCPFIEWDDLGQLRRAFLQHADG